MTKGNFLQPIQKAFLVFALATTAAVSQAQNATESLFKLSVSRTNDSLNSQEWNPKAIRLHGVSALDIVTFVYKVNPAYFYGRERLEPHRFNIDYESRTLSKATGEGLIMDAVLRLIGVKIAERTMEMDVVILDKPKKLGPDIRSSFEATNTISIGDNGSIVGQTQMSGLARHLEGYFLKPVIDRTKMIGRFRWELNLHPGMSNAEVFAEIKARLGLEPRWSKEKVVMYSIESLDETSAPLTVRR